jgi:hypothetical protein
MMSRLNAASPEARKRGEELVAFLDEVRVMATYAELHRYLELRGCRRWRVVEWYGLAVVEFYLPPSKLALMGHIAGRRPVGVQWVVRPLRWWQRFRRIVVKPLPYEVVV